MCNNNCNINMQTNKRKLAETEQLLKLAYDEIRRLKKDNNNNYTVKNELDVDLTCLKNDIMNGFRKEFENEVESLKHVYDSKIAELMSILESQNEIIENQQNIIKQYSKSWKVM